MSDYFIRIWSKKKTKNDGDRMIFKSKTLQGCPQEAQTKLFKLIDNFLISIIL